MKLPVAAVFLLRADARKYAATDDHRLQAFAKGIRYALHSLTQETRMARRTSRKSARKPHHAAPLSTSYRVKASKPGRRNYVATNPQKRRAIREAHTFAQAIGIGARCEVKTKEGALVYQARLTLHAGRARFVVEEL